MSRVRTTDDTIKMSIVRTADDTIKRSIVRTTEATIEMSIVRTTNATVKMTAMGSGAKSASTGIVEELVKVSIGESLVRTDTGQSENCVDVERQIIGNNEVGRRLVLALEAHKSR